MSTTIRSIISLALVPTLGAALAVAGGCGGPTKAGLEARAEARDRMGLVNAQLSYDQAKRAFEVGQFDRALREITHAIDRYPHVPSYHLLQGRILLETHRLEQALRAFDTAIETAEQRGGMPTPGENSQAQAHYFAGIVFQRWSNHEVAHQRYIEAANLDESNAQYLLAAAESMIALEMYDEAHDVIAPRLAYFEHNSAMRHLLGHIALLRGDATHAAHLLAQARLLNPDDPMLVEELAWAEFDAKQFAQCLESLQQLKAMTRIGSGEKRIDLIHLEARCLMHLERFIDARNLYMELTRLSPADPEVWIELGAVAWDLGDHRRVAESAVRVIALAPDRYEGYALRGIHAHSQDRIVEAEGYFREASQRAPNHALPHLLLAQALEQRGKYEDALMLYGRIISMFPNNREAYMLFTRLSENPSLNHLTAVSDK